MEILNKLIIILQCTTLIGTPEFFPPEWYNTKKYTQDGATVWSLGCLMYILLTGKAPFQSTEEIPNALWVRERAVIKRASPLCADLLCRMMHPNPAERISLDLIAFHPFWAVPVVPMMPQPHRNLTHTNSTD